MKGDQLLTGRSKNRLTAEAIAMYELVFQCGPPEIPCAPSGVEILGPLLRLEIDEISANIAYCTFHYGVSDLKFSLPAAFSGWDFRQFSIGLQKLHATLEGKAELMDFCGETTISLQVVNRARGAIGISGRLCFPIPELYYADDWPLEIRFDGLMTEQTWLPKYVRDIESFIRESGIPVKNPWEDS